MMTDLLSGTIGPVEEIMAAVTEAQLSERADEALKLLTLWNAWDCPAAELPLLAWALSVEVWDDGWPLDKKRRVVAESLALHRQKTTIAADRKVISYIDAELLTYHLPRDGFAIGSEVAGEDRQKWLLSLPEVRIYPLPPRRTDISGLPVVGDEPLPGTSEIAKARRAELIGRNETIPLMCSGTRLRPDNVPTSEIERVTIPKPFQASCQVGTAPFDAEVAPAPGFEAIFTFDYRRPGGAIEAGRPSLNPAEVTPKIVPMLREPEDAIEDGGTIDAPLSPMPGPGGYYLSIRINDGSAPAIEGITGSAIGYGRLGRKPFTKELGVLMLRADEPAMPFDGPLTDDPADRVTALYQAIGGVQALRDTVHVDLNMIEELTVDDADDITEQTRIDTARIKPRR
ncbi:phage tail protein I [Notoacmeibacter ruber]|uniref:Phage tail protein I n=1 Tax=Notoacmeibacter ruber TaxID=2670375 RepID=A0A3L7JDQ4_9HYPH|nr:phage tail protein I [Notoacmeibacter ruber]RLQ88918.1 phage tail protein I [Notoacmeibacter ruber]